MNQNRKEKRFTKEEDDGDGKKNIERMDGDKTILLNSLLIEISLSLTHTDKGETHHSTHARTPKTQTSSCSSPEMPHVLSYSPPFVTKTNHPTGINDTRHVTALQKLETSENIKNRKKGRRRRRNRNRRFGSPESVSLSLSLVAEQVKMVMEKETKYWVTRGRNRCFFYFALPIMPTMFSHYYVEVPKLPSRHPSISLSLAFFFFIRDC